MISITGGQTGQNDLIVYFRRKREYDSFAPYPILEGAAAFQVIGRHKHIQIAEYLMPDRDKPFRQAGPSANGRMKAESRARRASSSVDCEWACQRSLIAASDGRVLQCRRKLESDFDQM